MIRPIRLSRPSRRRLAALLEARRLRVVLSIGGFALLLALGFGIGPAVPTADAQDDAEAAPEDTGDLDDPAAFRASTTAEVMEQLALNDAAEQLRPLSLEDAIATGLADNITLRRVDREPVIARASRTIAQSQFDWILSASTRYTRGKDQSPGTDTHTMGWNNSVTLSRFFDTGTQASITYFYNKSEAETANTTGISVNDSTGLTLSLDQDLLRNLGFAPNLYRIKLSDIGLEQADATVIQQRRQIRFAIEQAYWNLVFAFADLSVTARSLELAVREVDVTLRQEDAGIGNRLDVLQAQVFEAQKRQELFDRRRAVRDLSDELLALVFPGQLLEMLDRHPILFPQGHEFQAPASVMEQNVREAVESALINRQVIVQAKLGRESRELDVEFFRQQLLPDLSAVAGLTVGGGGPTTGQAIEGFGNTNQTNWFLGLEFSYPLENSTARGNLQQAQAAQEQSDLDVQQATIDVVREVLAVVRSIRTLRRTLDTAVAAEQLAERQVDAADRRLNLGSGTRFQLDSFREDLDIARRNRRRVEVNLQIAIANLRLVTGTIDQSAGASGEANGG